jgi:hypothetical protein
MPRHTQQAFYVIRASRHPKAGPRWFTRAGTVTTIRSKAARFVTVEEAHAFAEARAITLNGVTRAIDLEEFTTFELSVFPG